MAMENSVNKWWNSVIVHAADFRIAITV